MYTLPMVKAALIGAGVALACMVVPIIHFVTFLPAGFIGGYFAGLRAACTPGQALAVGALMAVFLTAPAVVAVFLISLLDGDFSLTFIFSGVLVILAWFGSSGAIGAALGGWSSRRRASA